MYTRLQVTMATARGFILSLLSTIPYKARIIIEGLLPSIPSQLLKLAPKFANVVVRQYVVWIH